MSLFSFFSSFLHFCCFGLLRYLCNSEEEDAKRPVRNDNFLQALADAASTESSIPTSSPIAAGRERLSSKLPALQRQPPPGQQRSQRPPSQLPPPPSPPRRGHTANVQQQRGTVPPSGRGHMANTLQQRSQQRPPPAGPSTVQRKSPPPGHGIASAPQQRSQRLLQRPPPPPPPRRGHTANALPQCGSTAASSAAAAGPAEREVQSSASPDENVYVHSLPHAPKNKYGKLQAKGRLFASREGVIALTTILRSANKGDDVHPDFSETLGHNAKKKWIEANIDKWYKPEANGPLCQ